MQINTATRDGRLLYAAVSKLINHETCHIDFPIAPDGPAVIAILEDIANQLDSLKIIPEPTRLQRVNAAMAGKCEDKWRAVADERPPISDCRPTDPIKPTKVRTEVIVATKEGRVFATVFTALGFANVNSRTDEVTHWMPKPDHPAPLTAQISEYDANMMDADYYCDKCAKDIDDCTCDEPDSQSEFIEPPGNNWWCPSCKQSILPQHVTYKETHDTRAGGCGSPVLPEVPDYGTRIASKIN